MTKNPKHDPALAFKSRAKQRNKEAGGKRLEWKE